LKKMIIQLPVFDPRSSWYNRIMYLFSFLKPMEGDFWRATINAAITYDAYLAGTNTRASHTADR